MINQYNDIWIVFERQSIYLGSWFCRFIRFFRVSFFPFILDKNTSLKFNVWVYVKLWFDEHAYESYWKYWKRVFDYK